MASECNNSMNDSPWSQFDEKVKNGICAFLKHHSGIGGLCSKCGESDMNKISVTKIDLFKVITEVKCNNCPKYMTTVCTPSKVRKTKIENIAQLKEGDHIAWFRCTGHWHHAIYVGKTYTEAANRPTEGSQEQQNNSQGNASSSSDWQEPELCDDDCCYGCWPAGKAIIYVIEYTAYERYVKLVQSKLYLKGISVFRVDYDDCYESEYTKYLAIETWKSQSKGVEETALGYGLIGENCEHFARRCKTGKSFSSQVQSCRKRILHGVLMTMARLVGLAIWTICEALVPDDATTADNHVKDRLRLLELDLSIVLYIFFCLVYCTFAIYQECKEIKNETPCRKNSESALAVSKKHNPCFKRFIYYSCRCDKCSKACCEAYGHRIFKVLIREIIASGLPVTAFALFEMYCIPPTCPDNRYLVALYGCLIGLGVMPFSLLIGNVFSACIVQLCCDYICCCKCTNSCRNHSTESRSPAAIAESPEPINGGTSKEQDAGSKGCSDRGVV